MSELPDFLGGEPASADQAPVAAPEPTAAAPEASAAPVEAAAPAQAAPAAPEVAHAPITALLDEREKRQAEARRADAAEKEARELREWRQQQEERARRRPAPDREQDPEAYEHFQRSQISAALYDQRLDMSRFKAEQRHGEQVVTEAFKWGEARCDADPHFNAKVASSRDPVGLVVEEWKRDQIASKVDPNEYQAYLDWKASQPGALPGAQPAAPAAPPAKPAAPRPSLASGPSAGSSAAPVPRNGEQTFDAMFS